MAKMERQKSIRCKSDEPASK